MKLVLLMVALAVMVQTSHGAAARAILEVGKPYTHDFGPNNSVIKREYQDKPDSKPQFIYAGSNYWTDEKKQDKFDEGNVHFYANGTLVFDKVKETDFAAYSMPDEPPQKRGENAFVGNSVVYFEGQQS